MSTSKSSPSATSHVFAVYVTDCVYEGGGVTAIFSTREKATEYALARVEVEKEDIEKMRRYSIRSGHDTGEPDPWKEESPGDWTDGMHAVRVISYQLDDSAVFTSLEADMRRAKEQ